MNRRGLIRLLPAIALIMTALLAGGCGGGSPSSVVDDYIAAINDHDFDRVYDLASSSYQESSPRDEFIGGMEAVWIEGARLEDYEVIEETVDGDAATVTFKTRVVLPGVQEELLEENESSVDLVKEEGEWKIDFKRLGEESA